MEAVQDLFINGVTIEFLNGDESYMVTVFYRDAAGNTGSLPDKFSFSTTAKLKRFISKQLLTSQAAEAVGNV